MVRSSLWAHCALVVTCTASGCYEGTRSRPGASGGIVSGGFPSGDDGSVGEDTDDGGFDEGTDDGGESDDDGTGASTADDTDGAPSPDSSGDEPEPAAYAPALDIAPVGVHVNQGVAIPIADAGASIDVGRIAPVVHGRRSLVFATWQLAPTFAPRMIRAELHLAHADGSAETVVSEVMVDGPSGMGQQDRHFAWTLEPEQLAEGTRWSVTLHELEAAGVGDPPAPRLPATDAPFDDEDGAQRIRVVLVPYRHQYGGCNQVAPTDAATIDGFRETMESIFPTQSVEITVHPEVVYTGSMAQPDPVLADTTALRAAESPAVDVYYYGLLHPCDASTTYGGYGYVPLDPGSAIDAPYRASIGIWYDFDPVFSYETMAHEVGHNHGRDHVACSGAEAGTDPAYPNPGGLTGSLGWGIHDESFRPSTFADYMSYCNDLWVSPYGWARTLGVIDALTLLAGASGNTAPTEDGAVLVVVQDGEVTAARYIAGLVPRHIEGDARWVRHDGTEQTLRWERARVPDSDATFVTVGLSDDELDRSAQLVLELDGTTITVDGAMIRR